MNKRKNTLSLKFRNLVHQNGEIEKRMTELSQANQELIYQIGEKEKCAMELIIANKELAYQNKEKEKRSEELHIANQELVLQNTEKEKRTAELRIANRELKHTEEDLVRSRAQLRNFAHHLNHIQEEDRAHLARELHDELSQQLAGIKMGLSLITMFGSKEKMAEKARDMLKDVDSAIQAMRKIATELRPGILDSLGLIPSLEWLGMEFEKNKKIKCITISDVNGSSFEKDISNCFFRVCQESLTNICKHADATEVNIELHQDLNNLTMKISDNGKGIASEKLENPFSMGLLGMRERASLIGAELNVISKKDSGTTIQLKAPIKNSIKST